MEPRGVWRDLQPTGSRQRQRSSLNNGPMLTSLSESVAIVIGNYPTARQAGILPEERGSHVRRDAARVKKQEAQMIIVTMRVSNDLSRAFLFQGMFICLIPKMK